MEYDVIVTLNGTILDVNLNITLESSDKVYYYLYLCGENKEIVGRSKWRNDSAYSFDLSELGGVFYM